MNEQQTPSPAARRQLRRWLREERLVSPEWLLREGFVTEQDVAEAKEWAASIRAALAGQEEA